MKSNLGGVGAVSEIGFFPVFRDSSRCLSVASREERGPYLPSPSVRVQTYSLRTELCDPKLFKALGKPYTKTLNYDCKGMFDSMSYEAKQRKAVARFRKSVVGDHCK